MNRLKNLASKATQITLPNQVAKPTINSINQGSQIDKYRNFHKSGPELFITKILMLNGPLTSHQIWRIYQRELQEAKKTGNQTDIEYWASLTKMKQTLKFMRINQKLKGSGYNQKAHLFQGWKIQEKRALKYVHPSVIAQIQEKIAKRDNL